MHFWAAWCEPCAFLDSVLAQLSADAPAVAALRVEAEEAGDISERYSVSVVPYFLFFRDGQVADSLEGADAAALTTKFQALAAGGAAGAPAAAPATAAVQPPAAVGGGGQAGLQERLKQLVNQQPVMLFMKVGQAVAVGCWLGCVGAAMLSPAVVSAHLHVTLRTIALRSLPPFLGVCNAMRLYMPPCLPCLQLHRHLPIGWGRAWVMRTAESPRARLRANTTGGAPERKAQLT